MTEKRFEITETIDAVWDNREGEPLSTERVVELLNTLLEQNQRLFKEREQLKKKLDSFKPVMFQDMRKGTVLLYTKKRYGDDEND